MEDRARGLEDYARALEDERRKIEMLQRELPLSLQLVTQAIESVKQQMGVGEAAACEQPVLEEFLPMKPSCSSSDEEEGRCRHSEAKPDWLRSVSLWNQDAGPLPKSDPVVFDGKKSGGAFHPFDKDKNRASPQATAAAVASSSAETTAGRGGGGRGNGRLCEKKQEGQSQMQRKSRRCWSPELHRCFLHALQQLGGSQAATPKQIRELMKVDGLTNDEVKSHLQKYRLHSRRSNQPMESNNSTSSHPPQFVVVSGIWVPPPEYSAAVTPSTEGNMAPLNGICAPVASLVSEIRPNNKKQARRSASDPLHSEGIERREDEDGVTNSPSPVTSSSSQTTTTS